MKIHVFPTRLSRFRKAAFQHVLCSLFSSVNIGFLCWDFWANWKCNIEPHGGPNQTRGKQTRTNRGWSTYSHGGWIIYFVFLSFGGKTRVSIIHRYEGRETAVNETSHIEMKSIASKLGCWFFSQRMIAEKITKVCVRNCE